MDGFAFEFDSKSLTFARRNFTLPRQLNPGEVLVRVTCCTICGSDLHTFCGRRSAPANCVLGHEIIGTIEAWGGRVTPVDVRGESLSVGDRVTWAMAVGCGDCFFCNSGLSQKCDHLFKYGHQSAGTIPTGGLSQYCLLVPGTPVFRIPESLSDQVACPANCATATVAAAIRLISETHRIESRSVLIVGAGLLGLTASAMLCDAGASQILVADLDSKRTALAASFGATHAVAPDDPQSLFQQIDSATEGRGVDIALDFAGALGAVTTAIESVRTGGCILLAGSVFPMEELGISPESIVRRMLTIRGLHNYGVPDLDRALRFLERTHARFPFHDLVSSTFELAQAPLAFEQAQQGHIRVAVSDG
ncbi:MAG: zinc-binding dehydrogenase [Planctomycetota bacterium]